MQRHAGCACGGHCPRCRGGARQPKLEVNTPGDAYEREAERIAEAVVSGTSTSGMAAGGAAPQLQRCACGGRCSACRAEEEKPLQRAGAGAAPAVAPPLVHQVLASPGRPLESGTRSFMEARFGADFAGVRVHTDGRAAESARAVGATAYTVGHDVVFGAGQYAPGTDSGRRLLAHELTHVLQQRGAGNPSPAGRATAAGLTSGAISPGRRGVSRVASGPLLQRACGSTAIGTPTGCIVPPDYGFFVPGHPLFKFDVNCDDFAAGEAAALTALAGTLPAGATLEIHGFASTDGDATFNHNLGCARALAAQSLLAGAGIAPSRITGVFNHGATAGPADERRSVVIRVSTPPAATRHRFRVAAVSFLSCAECNPFTDDGTLGITPPTTEPPVGSSFRQLHHIEAELETFDGRTISSARRVSAGNNVGVSGFCGTTTRAHVVSFTGAGAPRRITSPAGVEGIELESEMSSRVGAVVPPTLPFSPCGFLGTNPLIPVIGNSYRIRLFADGTKESGFVSNTLYPSHFLYEDGALKLFGGNPVHPRIDFFAWAGSTGVPLAASIIGFKALRFVCCNPRLSGLFCDTVCRGGVSVPRPGPPIISPVMGGFDPRLCAIHVASLAAGACPTACAPTGASCSPLVLPPNP